MLFSRQASTSHGLPIYLVAVFAALALVGATAGAAQASEWEVNTASGVKTLSEIGSSETINIAMSEGGSQTLTWTLGGTQVTSKCSALSSIGARITPGGTGSGKLTLSGCTMVSPPGCAPPAKLTTSELKFATQQAGGKTYLVFEPSSGSSIATIMYTGTCAIAGTPFKIAGQLWAELPSPSQLLVSHAAAFSSAGHLTVAGNSADFTAPVKISLSGANAGRSWKLN